jgi:hypothetical protein
MGVDRVIPSKQPIEIILATKFWSLGDDSVQDAESVFRNLLSRAVKFWETQKTWSLN